MTENRHTELFAPISHNDITEPFDAPSPISKLDMPMVEFC